MHAIEAEGPDEAPVLGDQDRHVGLVADRQQMVDGGAPVFFGRGAEVDAQARDRACRQRPAEQLR
jgi:hypothetical protein